MKLNVWGETENGSVLYLQTVSMESDVSGDFVCSVSMFETLTTLPESIHFGTFGWICFLIHSSTIFAPASSVHYYIGQILVGFPH